MHDVLLCQRTHTMSWVGPIYNPAVYACSFMVDSLLSPDRGIIEYAIPHWRAVYGLSLYPDFWRSQAPDNPINGMAGQWHPYDEWNVDETLAGTLVSHARQVPSNGAWQGSIAQWPEIRPAAIVVTISNHALGYFWATALYQSQYHQAAVVLQCVVNFLPKVCFALP